MLENFLININPIGIFILITFLIGFLFLELKKIKNKVLFTLLLVCLLTEVLSIILIEKKIFFLLLYSISFIFHHSIWLFLICNYINNKKLAYVVLVLFIGFSIFNILYIEKTKLNCYTFILGAMFYLILFIYKSYLELKLENLSFFKTNDYLLLFAPVIFFFGLSFIFSFRDLPIKNTFIFYDLKLYTFISYFVNIVYYALINIYIYKERKLKNG